MTLLDIEAPAQEVRRDRWGRPLCLPLEAFDDDGFVKPGKWKQVGLQRVTTLAKAAEDTSNLTDWACRMTLLGAASRADIIASAQAADPDDRKTLNALVEKAKELGGANIRRELGTAVHKFFELKAADPTYTVPEPYAADVDAILATIDANGFDIVTEHSEQLVVIYAIGCSGTPDLILRDRSRNTYHIGDLKTGASVKYGALGWATQLTAYSMADAFYYHGDEKDGSEDRIARLELDVSREHGFIIHCEPGSGSADMYRLSLNEDFVSLAVDVREIRKRRDLLTPFVGGGTDTPTELGTAVQPGASVVVGSVDDTNNNIAAAPVTSPAGPVSSPAGDTIIDAVQHEARTAWAINRTNTCIERLTAQHVAQVWPTDLPRPKAIKNGTAIWSARDIDLIAAALNALEAKHDVPFGEEDPKVTAERRALDAADRQRELNRFQTVKAKPEPTVSVEVEAEVLADPGDVAMLRQLVAELKASHAAKLEVVQQWQREGDIAGHPWKIGLYADDAVPLRLWTIVMAAVGCIDLIDLDARQPDRRVRDALAAALGDIEPAAKTGALFGLLTTEQAETLAATAGDTPNPNPNNSKEVTA